MSAAKAKNPIERRLDLIADDWNQFAENADARVLRWMVDSESSGMLDVFLEVQQNETGDIPDLFVIFDQPLDAPDRYGFVLCEFLAEQYHEIREAIAEDDIPSDWEPPNVGDLNDVEAFVTVCTSFRAYYEGTMVHLALALMPMAVTSAEDWSGWLARLLALPIPSNVRFMVVDHRDAPILGELADSQTDKLVTVTPELDMGAAYSELARGGSHLPGAKPGVEFRQRFVALNNAAKAGNLSAAEKNAELAIDIATQQKWPQMQVAVSLALGAAYMASGQMRKALAAYRQGSKAVESSEDPAAPKLLIQCRLAEGSALVSEGQFSEAATVYEQTAPLAEEQDDTFSALESWRMAGYCYEASDEFEAAWSCGQKALDASETMDAEARANSTVPYAAESLIRIVKQSDFSNRSDGLSKRLEQLLGSEWRQKLPSGATPP